MCTCTSVWVDICMFTCVDLSMWRPKINIVHLTPCLSTLFFEAESLAESRTVQFGLTSQIVIFLSPPQCQSSRRAALPSAFMWVLGVQTQILCLHCKTECGAIWCLCVHIRPPSPRATHRLCIQPVSQVVNHACNIQAGKLLWRMSLD